jgi:hypothetical protein
MDITLMVRDESGQPVKAKIHLVYFSRSGEELHAEAESDGRGTVILHSPEFARLDYVVGVPHEPGFWSIRIQPKKIGGPIIFPRLPAVSRPAWWLDSIGLDCLDSSRGSGIRIGVVDSDLRRGNGLEHVRLIEETGILTNPPDAHHCWGHAEAICRILADRSSEAALLAVAPGADIVFADASSENGNINPTRAISAIYNLVTSEEVDIVNLSWGYNPEGYLEEIVGEEGPPIDLPGLRDVIEVASELGVIIVTAAGNDPIAEDVAFPARLPECIAVGALGFMGWGPLGSAAQWYGDTAENPETLGTGEGSQILYAWPGGTFGPGVDVIAPGVGVLFQRNGKIAFDVSGTSFATPVVSGLLAVALARDKGYLTLPRSAARAQSARKAFFDICYPSGMTRYFEGSGVPNLRRQKGSSPARER